MNTPNISAEIPTLPAGHALNQAPKSRPTATLGLDLLRLGGLATLCMGAALVLNQLREPPLPLVYASKQTRMYEAVKRAPRAEAAPALAASSPAGEAAARNIDLAEFQILVAAKRAVVLDARPEIFHRLGHVPGALSLSREEFERDYAVHRALLESKRGQPIAVYCSSASCKDSQMVADALVKLDYRQVLVFKGGWDEWTQSGGEEEKK